MTALRILLYCAATASILGIIAIAAAATIAILRALHWHHTRRRNRRDTDVEAVMNAITITDDALHRLIDDTTPRRKEDTQ